MTAAHILIVDDDIRICHTLSHYLKREGYRVSTAGDGDDMWRQFEADQPDLVLLDLILPGTDGITLARKLRDKSDVGIIMLTAKDSPVDTIIGLEIGADDYVTKPFDERQLLARIRSVLRRRNGIPQISDDDFDPDNKVWEFDGWRVDMMGLKLYSSNGENVELTSHEFRLLEIFIKNSGTVLSRDKIKKYLSNRDMSANDRSIDVLIGKLRKKIEIDINDPKFILTIRGLGYKFTAKVRTVQS